MNKQLERLRQILGIPRVIQGELRIDTVFNYQLYCPYQCLYGSLEKWHTIIILQQRWDLSPTSRQLTRLCLN